MALPLPESYRRFFKASTLSTAHTAAQRSRIADVLFFRNAYLLTITENGVRNFQPRFVVDDGKVPAAWCSCTPELKPYDLCRHVAIALSHVSSEDETHLADRFLASLWHEVAQLVSEKNSGVSHEKDGEAIVTRDGSGEAILVTRFAPTSTVGLLSCFPDDVRPEDAPALPMREQLLRRMSVTTQEAELEKRGVVSRKQQWETSFWYAWSRAAFSYFADHDITLQYVVRGAGAFFELTARRGDVAIDLRLPHRAVARVVERDGGTLARRSGFEVHPNGALPDLRLELGGEGGLHLQPMICATVDGVDRVDPRESVMRLDRWFFYPEGAAFLSVRDASPRFGERKIGQQGSLFGGSTIEGGYPREREAHVASGDMFAFLEKHRDEILGMRPELVTEALRIATPARLDEGATFRMRRVGESVEIEVLYRCGTKLIPWRDVARARRKGEPVLVVAPYWVDVTDPQFGWIDSLKSEALEREELLFSRLEYLRLRASVRGEVTVEGDENAIEFFQNFEDLRLSGGAPSLLDLGIDLYGYQQTGYQWLWFLQQNGLGGLLCDDMGLGKTHQAMALLRALTDECSTASVLIVCPTSLIPHWREKLAQYVPSVRFEMYVGDKRKLTDDAQAVVTSYGVMRNDIEVLAKKPFDLVILDEAQIIKNRSSQTNAALSQIRKSVAIGLTGTPVENRLQELHTLLDFVVPGYLPGQAEFERSFVEPIESRGDAGARSRLHRLIHPFVLRRTKTQVLDQLPAKIVDVRHCELTPAQRELYREVLAGRARPLREQLAAGKSVSYLHVFAVLNYLKQVCNHPALFGDEHAATESGKWMLFRELLDEALASGLKVVVFSQYVRMLKLIERDLDERGIGWATIKGDTRDRGGMLEKFRNDPDCRVFSASLRAGGLGIDLTSASVVIHYDRWWNQAREDQATDRVHRLGQNKGVQVLKLITRGTLEEKIDQIIARKALLASDVVREDDPTLVKQFTRDELESLLEEP